MKDLKRILTQAKATVHIGKNGLTEQVLNEIRRQLKDRGYVKVKMEKSVVKILEYDRREVAQEVAELIGATLLDIRGRTFILVDFKILKNKRGGKNMRFENLDNTSYFRHSL